MFSNYQAVGKKIKAFIEINDDCVWHFESIRANIRSTKRQLKMCYVYFETSHGKSKLDGLGGAIK